MTSSEMRAADALVRRLQAALEALGCRSPEAGLESCLSALESVLAASPQPQSLWLTHIAFLGRFPADGELAAMDFRLRTDGAGQVLGGLLESRAAQPESWTAFAGLDITEAVVVDVSHTARFDGNTGIQRVVRETVPLWEAAHDLALAVFDSNAAAFRRAAPSEADRVLRWDAARARGAQEQPDPEPATILVPWKTCVILPELAAEAERADALRVLGRWSGNSLATIIYDLIPFTLPEAFLPQTRRLHMDHMAVVRSSHRASAISEAVAQDYRVFAHCYERLGMGQPDVRAHPLPVAAPAPAPATGLGNSSSSASAEAEELITPGAGPLILSVSSTEPRKNHVSTLRAAEILWREGHAFQLVFIAGSGWRGESFDAEIDAAVQRGRAVKVIRQAGEELLWMAYRRARFTVFVSLAEGFGLPAAESIAAGTPVILSDYGSMAEIGADGGAVLVDPRELNGIVTAMRTLLTDDSALESLRRQAAGRPQRSWDDYADQTWQWLTRGSSPANPQRQVL